MGIFSKSRARLSHKSRQLSGSSRIDLVDPLAEIAFLEELTKDSPQLQKHDASLSADESEEKKSAPDVDGLAPSKSYTANSLLRAVKDENPAQVEEILFRPSKRGPIPVDELTDAFFYAIEKGVMSVLPVLLSGGASVNPSDKNEMAPPLNVAVAFHHLQVVHWLISHGAAIDTVNCEGYTALDVAVQSTDDDIVKVLLRSGATVNDHRTALRQTALHRAAAHGTARNVKLLLDYKAIISARDSVGRTPLHLAALHGNIETTKALLRSGAMVDFQDDGDNTPLHLTLLQGFQNVAEKLLDAFGATTDSENSSSQTPLLLASRKCMFSTVGRLLYIGAEVNAETLAEAACSDGKDKLKVMDLIIAKNKETVNMRTRQGQTPLHLAAGHGDREAVEKLLKAGADVNMQDLQRGETALHYATRWLGAHQAQPIVVQLTEAGADYNIRNDIGRTALYIPVRERDYGLERLWQTLQQPMVRPSGSPGRDVDSIQPNVTTHSRKRPWLRPLKRK